MEINNELTEIQNRLDNLKLTNEMNTLGFLYRREDLCKETLHEKYGKIWLANYDISNPDEIVSDEDVKVLNDYDHRFLINNFDKIPMGLEKRIHLGWFMHFFTWDKIDTYSAEVQGGFRGDWLDVPYPNAKSIYVDGYRKFNTQLTEPCYNWNELFIIINDLMFQHGRVHDIGITGVETKWNSEANCEEIRVTWSS